MDPPIKIFVRAGRGRVKLEVCLLQQEHLDFVFVDLIEDLS